MGASLKCAATRITSSSDGRLSALKCSARARPSMIVDAPGTRLRQADVRSAGPDGHLGPATPGSARSRKAASRRSGASSRAVPRPRGAVAFYVSAGAAHWTEAAAPQANKLAEGCASCTNHHRPPNSRPLHGRRRRRHDALARVRWGRRFSYAVIEHADTFVFLGSNAAKLPPSSSSIASSTEVRAHGAWRDRGFDPRRTPAIAAAKASVAPSPSGRARTSRSSTVGFASSPTRGISARPRVHRAAHGGLWSRSAKAHRRDLAERGGHRLRHRRAPGRPGAIRGDDRATRARAHLSSGPWASARASTGTFTANAIVNLHLATGQILRAGSGPFTSRASPTPWARPRRRRVT